VERGRLLEQREETIAPPALRVQPRRRLLVFERHPKALREPLDRLHEVEPLCLPDEGDRIAADAAAETVVRAPVRRDRERRRPLVVERAKAGVASADLAQPRARLDEGDEIRRLLDCLDGSVLDPRHQSRPSQNEIANRSVIPAMYSTASSAASPRPIRCSKIRRTTSRARRCSSSTSGPRYTRSNMNERRASIASPTSSLCRMSPARSEVSIRSWTSVSMRAAPVGPSRSISLPGRSSSLRIPKRIASSMSWL